MFDDTFPTGTDGAMAHDHGNGAHYNLQKYAPQNNGELGLVW
jgi:hypothetical protein